MLNGFVTIYLGKVKPDGYKNKTCRAYVDFGFSHGKPFIKYEIWRGGKGSISLTGNTLDDIAYLIEDEYFKHLFNKLSQFDLNNLSKEKMREFIKYFNEIRFENENAWIVQSIIKTSGGRREKSIIKNGVYEIHQSETWNEDHKVVHVIRAIPDKDGHRDSCDIDIVTRKICG